MTVDVEFSICFLNTLGFERRLSRYASTSYWERSFLSVTPLQYNIGDGIVPTQSQIISPSI